MNLFFAISGFLICGLLLKEYQSRRRHQPAALLPQTLFPHSASRTMLSLAVLCALSILGAIHINYSDLPSCLLFYRNYTPLEWTNRAASTPRTSGPWPSRNTSTLFGPCCCMAVKPKRAGKVAFLLAMAVFAWRVLEGHFEWFASVLPPADLLTRTDTMMDALLWGCLAAIYFPEIVRFSARIRFSQLWLPDPGHIAGGREASPSGFDRVARGAHACLGAEHRPPAGELAGSRSRMAAVALAGHISYSLYLWQELFLPAAAS